ncbi:MAG: hypothetical protein H6977_01960 [Gammaproteobacteria bacterium]|nr:hypothetical protein [Gammaproteobacteria bacterium]MCP5198748.1 hypothetical protein [Gammaproteobacteria bacterium]
MLALLLSFLVGGARLAVPEGLPTAPFDLAPGRQVIELRAPLVARAPGARLVLFVPALARAGSDDSLRAATLMAALPPASVSAVLSSADGHRLELVHSGYRSYHGQVGLVLTEVAAGAGNVAYTTLELDSRIRLQNVRAVWLDQPVRRVEDLELGW